MVTNNPRTFDPFKGAFNGIEASLALFPETTFKFCALEFSRSAIAGKTLYIDGGSLKLYSENNTTYIFTEINNRLLWIDLSEPFNQTKFKFGSATKPLELVNQDGDALVPDPAEDKFYVFGGRYATWNTSSNYFQKPPARNTGDVWLYDGSKRQWTLQETTGSKIQRITMGAATVDYNTGIIYYVGGRYDNWVVRDFAATVYVDGLLTVDTSQPTPTWTNKTIPIDSASIYEGFLQYVPLGKEGILVRFGGWRFPKGSLNPGGVLSNMTTIDIYDIGSATWNTQLASGVPGSPDGIPAPRYYGCSVMVSSPDNSSYNIYIYGGESKPGLPGSKFNDVWALLIPTFTWVKLSSTGSFVSCSSCTRSGRFMFVVGSVTGYNACNALWSIFDMVTLEWVPYFDPNAQYEVPLLISDIIGGDATGGATKKVPVNGWSSKEVEAVFSPSSKFGPNKDGSSNANSDKAITLTPSKIAGVSVGGVLFLAMAVGLFFVLRYRKNRSRRAMEIPLVTPYGELPAFGGLFLDKAELPAALVHELPNSVPVPPQRG